MPRAPDRSVSRRDHLLFAACVLLSAGAIAVPPGVALTLAGAARETVLAPVVALQQFGAEGRTSRARLAALQAERDSVALVGISLPALEEENAELRRLLGLPARVRQEWTSAEVLHQPVPTDGRSVLLSAGTATGVQMNAPVIAADGLLGVVVQASPNSSVALTWAHPEYRVSAVTLDGAVQGIVAAASTPEASDAFLEFRGVAFRDTVATGTLVVTSGLTGLYPRGIPIGRVAGVRREQLGWERVYRLVPLVNPSRVGHVMILRTRPGRSEVFPTDTGTIR